MNVFDADADAVLSRAATVHHVGLGDVWDQIVSEDDSPSRRVLLAVVSSLALYMDESGLRVTPTTAGVGPQASAV